jgi:hypothetical protein
MRGIQGIKKKQQFIRRLHGLRRYELARLYFVGLICVHLRNLRMKFSFLFFFIPCIPAYAVRAAIIALQKAGRSSGFRAVITLPSTTHS